MRLAFLGRRLNDAESEQKSCPELAALGIAAPDPAHAPFRQHLVESRLPLVVSDTREHALLRDNRAIRDLGVTAPADTPLITPDGHVL